MKMLKTIKLLLYIQKLNLLSLIEYKKSFVVAVISMTINNFILFLSFYLLFIKFKFIWWFTQDQYSLLMWFVFISFGISSIFFWGAWMLVYNIPQWKLDHYLLLPKNTLLLVLLSDISLTAFWEIISWLVLVSFYKNFSLLFLAKLLFFAILSSFIFISFLIIVNSLAFWFWRTEKISVWLREWIMGPSLYPYWMFKNTILYILFFTILPVWWWIWVPLELTVKFDFIKFLYFLLVVIWFGNLSYFIFYRWLRRYESWNLMNVNM